MLEEELRYFDEHWKEWEAAHPGKYVLVKGSALLGFYESLQDAVMEGLRRFPRTPFMARPLSAQEREVRIPAIALGVPYADPPHTVKR